MSGWLKPTEIAVIPFLDLVSVGSPASWAGAGGGVGVGVDGGVGVGVGVGVAEVTLREAGVEVTPPLSAAMA